MAVFDYSVTPSDVKERIPVDTRTIPASTTSGRLDDTDITGWIEEGAAEMSGVLEKSGLDGGDLDDEALQQIQTAIEHYAAAETLSSMGHTGSSYSSIRDRYESIRDRYEDDPSRLDRTTTTVDSNVDTSKQVEPQFTQGPNYRHDF